MNTKIRKSYRLLSLLAVLTATLGSVVMISPSVDAQSSVSLAPGCYFRRSATDYGSRGCPNDDFRNAYRNRDVCFVTRSSVSSVYFEVNCNGLTLTGSHNGPRAQRVCNALEGEHYWNAQTQTCYHGPNCQIDPGANGVRTSGCTASSISQIYGAYMRGELISPSSSAPPSGGSTGSGGTGGSSGGSSSSGDSTYDPSDDVSPEQQCLNNDMEWVPDASDPTTGFCRSYQSKTTNQCQGDDIRSGVAPNDENYCGILDYFVIFTNVLSGLVGVVIIGSIIASGIQYSSAGSDPQKVSVAKNRIKWSIIALLFYMFGYGILTWLIPGGIF